MNSRSSEKSTSALRFADLGTLPKQMLAPIEGYEGLPVVSLEEAVKPLIGIVPKVERNVFIVKKNCLQPKDGLTSDESASIMLYTLESHPHEHSLHFLLNIALRSEQRQKLKPWLLYLRLVLTALARLPSTHRSVFRGVREDLQAQYPVGETLIWWSFSSCTSSVGVLESESFFGQNGVRTLFHIDCINGKDIRSHSFLKYEDEILLPPARELLVESCLNFGNGLRIIQLTETEPKYSLLETFSLSNSTGQSEMQRRRSSIQPIMATFSLATRTWTSDGVTVARGRGPGSAANQLHWPRSLCVDEEDTIIVVDWSNHRIVEWQHHASSGTVLVGHIKEGMQTGELHHPTDVIIDQETNDLIISDWGNRRVLRCSRPNGTRTVETLIDNIDCWGLAMDNQRCLYVSDVEKHQVRRYRMGEKYGTVVAGGTGKGAALDQLNDPYYVCVDADQTIYVADNENHRVIKWGKDAKQGIVVAGGQDQGKQLTQLSHPNGVLIDAEGTLYISGWGNERVMRWCRGATQGTVVVGGNECGEGANQFSRPIGLSFDRHGNLYVADYKNHRVQRFSINRNE